MLPVFRPGETALVSLERPRPGDCAVYTCRGRTLLHRAVSVSADGAVFADDAGRLEPHLVPWGEVRGRALSRNPLAYGLPGLVYHKFRRGLSRLLFR
jgi:hypothetical protein